MKTTIQTWGNSLAVRIPKAFAVHLGMASGEEVELSMDRTGLRIVPAHDLDLLLEQVTPKNLHGETPTGDLQGQEIW